MASMVTSSTGMSHESLRENRSAVSCLETADVAASSRCASKLLAVDVELIVIVSTKV